MKNIDEIFNIEPYSLKKEQKQQFLVEALSQLTTWHMKNSKEYANIIKAFGYENKNYKKIEDFLALPVNLFKEKELKSTDEVLKTLTSSGTTSNKVSKIFLDKESARLQTKALIKIMQSFLGKNRLPMLIIDTPSVLKNKTKFSARSAGVMGLMNFGRKHTFILDDEMNLDVKALEDFLKNYQNEKFLMFGFTFMVWEYFYKTMKKQNLDLNFSNGILFHSGGWKKLQDKAVSNEIFKKSFNNDFKLNHIHNFYGMVEQIGSIFVECERGHLHTPNFADIIIRDSFSLKPLDKNQIGLIELVSIIPRSYPGHILLSEDLGMILGEDDCLCGRKGKYFKVLGRIQKAQIRGCSDTFEDKK